LRFLVAGTGRNGSKWIAEVMTGLGLLCGHERFSLEGAPFRYADGVLFQGDSSFQCVPHLRKVRQINPKIVVFLQLRNPLDYVTSIMGSGVFETAVDTTSPHGRYQMDNVVPPISPGDRVKTAMKMWVFWNDMAAPYAHMRYRLESVDAYKIRDILAWLGERRSLDHIEEAMQKASRNIHMKDGEDYERAFRESSFYPEMMAAARYYGYSV
jgi:hypothetical protein